MCIPVYASLDSASLEKIRTLESDLGLVLLAVTPIPKMAGLSPSQLAELQNEERKLGKVLVAYEV
jgi:hypothetical protein